MAAVLPPPPRATSVLVIGMAGSGKSTFAAALARTRQRDALDAAQSSAQGSADAAAAAAAAATPDTRPTPAYLVNLDPAVTTLGYEPNVDIRDTVDYRRVMEEYNLGPNGGILTALNLFTTKFDQVLGILEKRATDCQEIILDTPGQIEIFTWSASGSIITDALASAMPTCVAYVIDTPRTTAPATFMSNMLYACSIMYKTRLPFILVFNKTDVQSSDFALEWMKDFEAFQAALAGGNATEPSDVGAHPSVAAATRAAQRGEDQGYINSLMNSMALVLDEFYNNLRAVSVSSTTGDGIPAFFSAVQEARQEYLDDYRPELERVKRERDEKRERKKGEEVARLMRDMAMGEQAGAKEDGAEEEKIIDRYEGDGEIIEPDADEEMGTRDPDVPGTNQRNTHALPRSSGWDDGAQWPRPA